MHEYIEYLNDLANQLFNPDPPRVTSKQYVLRKHYCDAPENLICVNRDCGVCKMHRIEEREFLVYSN